MLGTLLLCSMLTTQPGPARVRALVEGRGRLPSLASVLAGPDERVRLRSASRRARWRGLVPRLRGRFGTDLDLGVRDASQRVITQSQALGGSVQASFDLSRLVFDDRESSLELQLQRMTERRRRRRQQLVDLYMRRVAVELEMEDEGPSVDRALEAARLDGRLEVVSDGAYGGSAPWPSAPAAGPSSPKAPASPSGSPP